MTFVSIAQQRDSVMARDRARSWIVDCAILAFAIVPLFLTAHVPLFDMPNHIARQYVIRDIATSPTLQQFYFVEWALVPNMAIEVFVAAVRSFLSIDEALRLFCIVTLTVTFVGIRLINLAIGGPASRIYRIAPLFFYSGSFQYGFLAFCFGLGLALVAFGLYIRYRSSRSSLIIPIFALAGCAILLSHLAAFGLYAIAVAAFEFAICLEDSRGKSLKTLAARLLAVELRTAAHLLPPLLLLAAFGSGPDPSQVMEWPDLRAKATAIASVFLFSSPVWEIGLFIFTAVGTGAALALGIFRVNRLVWPMAILMLIAFLVLPREALGTAYIDYRIPGGALLFALGFVTPGPAMEKFGKLAASWFSALVIGRVASIAVLWLSWEPVFAELDNTLQQLPQGSRVMVVEGWANMVEIHQPPIEHAAAFVVARRQGFEPNLFAGAAAQILRLQPEFQPLYQITPPDALDRIDPAYDHLLVIRPALTQLSPQLPLTLLAQGGDTYALYRVGTGERQRGN
jgi:hypothetical protein